MSDQIRAAASALVATAWVLLAACTSGPDGPEPGRSAPPGTAGQPGPDGSRSGGPPARGDPELTLLYSWDVDVDGGRMEIRRRDARGRTRTVLRLDGNRSAGPLRAGSTELLQVVRDRRPDIGGGHFDADPHLTLHDRRGARVADLGRGTAAEIDATGELLTWAVPHGPRTCEGIEPEGCTMPAATIVVADVAAPRATRQVARLDNVASVGWLTSDRLLVRRPDHRDEVLALDGSRHAAGFGGHVQDVDQASGRVLVADPDLRELKLVSSDGTELWRHDVRPARASGEIGPGGAHTVLHTVEAGSEGTAATSVRVLDEQGVVRTLDEKRADGESLWTDDGRIFTYRRATRSGRGFEFLACAVVSLRCGLVWAWRQGVQILDVQTSSP